MPYHARLSGTDTTGRVFKEDTQLDDLSVGGLHLRLTHNVPEGSDVSVAVRLSTVSVGQHMALRLAARGRVLRSIPQKDGSWGVAVEFKRRRIL